MKMKKNWTSLIMSIISAVIIVLLVTTILDVFYGIINKTSAGSDPSARRVLSMFIDVYKIIGWVFAGLTVGFGLLGVFTKAGNTLLFIFGILMILLGGVVMFLIPGILNIIAGSKGKAKFVKFQAEKAAAEKYAANGEAN